MNRFFPALLLRFLSRDRARDITEELVDAGRKVYCNLHKNHPAWTIARRAKNYSIILKAIDQMCTDPDYVPPPLPTPIFTGGQCEGEDYYVIASCKVDVWTWTSFIFEYARTVYPSVDTRSLNPPIVGAISDLYFISDLPCPQSPEGPADCKYGGRTMQLVVTDSEGVKKYRAINYLSGPFSGGAFTIATRQMFRSNTILDQDFDVKRVGDVPDVCGDLPPEFPPEFPPTPEDLTDIVTIINNDNVSNNYDVRINTDINGTINFPAVMIVNEVVMYFDVGGISIPIYQNEDQPSGNKKRRPNYPTPPGSKPIIDPILEPEPEPIVEPPPELVKVYYVQPGTREESVANLTALFVDIIDMPDNAKTAWGAGSPDIIYAGWIEFKRGSRCYPRQWIDFNQNTYDAPESATGYAVTIKIGYTAQIYKQFYVEEPVDG